MILAFAAKGKRTIACFMLTLLYLETIVPAYAIGAARATGNTSARPKPALVLPLAPVKTDNKVIAASFGGGPTQPEMEAFHSVNADNMVDLFSGNFSYNIPLLDVGGYPLAIGYSSGINMDQEASWVGLGWNINPGTITRNVRGIPDDFNGRDSIVKTTSVKENKTIGVTGGIDAELGGSPVKLGLGGSLSIFHNSYRGWGVETALNASVNVAASTSGRMGAGLSITSNSQEGLTLSPSLSYSFTQKDTDEKGGMGGSLSMGLSYNSRSGMKALQYSAGIQGYGKIKQREGEQAAVLKTREPGPQDNFLPGSGNTLSSNISFAYPSFTPGINIPYTSSMLSVSVKLGTELMILHPSAMLSGYVSKQTIAPGDTTLYLPAYGYLNYQNGARNQGALLDYNREREIPYRETPAVPNIAIPSYTYDVFSIAGEGTGGTFRAYRSDIGYVYDHYMRTRDASASVGVDVGIGSYAHVGVDFAFTRAYTQSGPWVENNPLASLIAFSQPRQNYESVYFRNPGETTINTNDFYNAVGGDDVVRPKLFQSGSSANITSTNYLVRYKNGRDIGEVLLTPANAKKQARDKRTQVITYLSAEEAGRVGFSKYIDNYSMNRFAVQDCSNSFPDSDLDQDGIGLKEELFDDKDYQKKRYQLNAPVMAYDNVQAMLGTPPAGVPAYTSWENRYIRWSGRIKAPVSGVYYIRTRSDDGILLRVNDLVLQNDLWNDHPADHWNLDTLNLEAGQAYNIQLDYRNGPADGALYMEWKCGDVTIDTKHMYWPDTTTTYQAIPGVLSKEERINSFRKTSHISEVDVLNADGKKFVYGIPVYNLKETEVTFAAKNHNGNAADGSVAYDPGTDNTTANSNGLDHYFSKQQTPAYAHSFLLTALVSPDYVDLTGNGISDDDPGNAIRFNYTKTAGIENPFKWRTPYSRKATYNEGLKTDIRDDKGSYVYGEKELWYLNAIESKNMIAVFKLGDRRDMYSMDENGVIDPSNHSAKRLEEINLYTKAEFTKKGIAARPVKTVHFEYTYELCKGVVPDSAHIGKLTLKKIWFTYNGNNKGKRNAYIFNYNSLNPGYKNMLSDRWGTYKDPAQNPLSVSGDVVTNEMFPYAIQDSVIAAANAAAWALDSIVLPSGGRMKVTYEGDDYAYVQNKRAAQMMRVAGFSYTRPTILTTLSSLSDSLHNNGNDKAYIAINVPEPVTSKEEVYKKYLEGMETIYFRLNVKMPEDKWGSGYEVIPGYARIDSSQYGFMDGGNTIWIKTQRIDKRGRPGGSYSAMAKTAVQFLRMNLPSKAYPGSDVGDNLDGADAVKLLFSVADNVINAVRSYDETARAKGWATKVDLTRSYVRLNNPSYKKYGGGHRVKRIVIYDHWNAMTKQKESMYGTEYSYTTTQDVHGVEKLISSGVAAYEPMLGGEENPFHIPIEYTEQVAALAPVSLGYVEMPLGESFFPGASVGYSCVRKRSIRAKNTRSATGFEESKFYTAYDFPVITEHSLISEDSKKRYKTPLGDILKINSRHHLVLSQGFKVELNDMHGKIRSKAIYAETDTMGPLSYSENFYHVDDVQALQKHLNNTVLTMGADGKIDTLSTIGKDLELMMDMREERSLSNGTIYNGNIEIFPLGIFVGIMGSTLLYPQRVDNIYRSAALTKVINRQGILDSTVTIEKGSKVVTHNMLFDAETGGVLLSTMQNEYNDTIYQFNYPSGWVYEGMSGAYKNINTILEKVNIKEGRIISAPGITDPAAYFTSGDEVLIYSRNKITSGDCDTLLASFYSAGKIWAIDANALNGGAPSIFFMDKDGKPFTGNDMTMKIIRSGRRNMNTSVGSVSMLANPLRHTPDGYTLVIDEHSKVINASMVEYKQNWQIDDSKKSKIICAY